MNRKLLFGFVLIAALTLGFLAGCNQAGAEEPAKEAAPGKVVASIVFADKENCCACTSERTEKSWAALQDALKEKSAKVSVTRIHVDTQAAKIKKYKAMKPMVTVPALYLLDAEGKLIDLLQGEVTKEQIEKFL